MDSKTEAIVLCAGMGSRIGLPPDQNKCASSIAGTSPVRHTVSALLRAGASPITVVVGHAAESVQRALADYEKAGQVRFAKNPYYNWHGCNYSLACAVADRPREYWGEYAGRVIIAEGDSLLHIGSIQQLSNQTAQAVSLVRSETYVDYKRSVIAIGEKGKILRYEYDATHRGSLPVCSDRESVIGESMQLWSFSGQPLKQLIKQLREYKGEADRSEIPFVHSGVYSINRLKIQIEPVVSEHPDDWINLNTQQDLRKAGNVKWLIK